MSPALNRSAARKSISLRGLHRVLGISCALVVLFLAVSGILLNHSAGIGLDRQYAGSFLRDWYAIEAPPVVAHFVVGAHAVSQLEQDLYLDQRFLETDSGRLVGAVRLNDEFVLATTEHILLLDSQGALIESLGAEHGVPVPLRGIGRIDGSDSVLVLRLGAGVATFDPLSLQVGEIGGESPANVNWSTQTAPDATLEQSLRSDFATRLLSWERVLRDLHSGRFLGPVGAWLMDLMALIFAVMAVTGILIWWRRRGDVR